MRRWLEFDIRTRLDHREYFEVRLIASACVALATLTESVFTLNAMQIPAIAIATLCYAFWLTFARVGAESVAPTTWPLVWLLFMAGLLINPLPMMFRESRWWLLRNFARLLTSGVHRVEVSAMRILACACRSRLTSAVLFFILRYASLRISGWGAQRGVYACVRRRVDG